MFVRRFSIRLVPILSYVTIDMIHSPPSFWGVTAGFHFFEINLIIIHVAIWDSLYFSFTDIDMRNSFFS